LNAPRDDYRVVQFTINEPIPAETFAPDFPAGTLVYDERTHRHWLAVTADTKPGTLNLRPLSIQQVLDAKAHFDLEPQPLEKALDVLHRRCKVDMLIDRPAFASAQLDLSMEVKPPPNGLTWGMTVREVIAHVLKQCPKPVGFEVQNDIIVIKPVAAR
jgi:hypothetical protein